MKIKKNTNRLQKFRNKYFSGKAGAMFLISRKMNRLLVPHESIGKLTDINLFRKEKNIVIELSNGHEVNNISISSYSFEHRKGDPYLVWKSVECEGPEEDRYKRLFNNLDGIELSKRYFSLVEAIL